MMLSVCDAVHCGTQGRRKGWKSYHYVTRRAFPIHFFRHIV